MTFQLSFTPRGKVHPREPVLTCVKGVYCLLVLVPEDMSIKVGALGKKSFARGCYVYVGSGMGGVEHRIGRHRSRDKKLHWHIDHLLRHASLVASIALQSSSREAECETVRVLAADDDARLSVPGFGSSDCRCKSHLLYFGDAEPEMVMETLTARLAMLGSAYPRTTPQRGCQASAEWE